MADIGFDRGTIRRSVPTVRRASRGKRSLIDVTVPRWPSLSDVFAWMIRETEMSRSRRALLDLDADQLRDIGLTRHDALREGRRSFYID